MMRNRTSHPGLTLLEVLAATAMVAVLAGSLYGTLHAAFRARESAINAMADSRAALVAMDFLRQDLQSAAGPNGLLAGPFIGRKEGTLGRGQLDALEFHCVAADAEPQAGRGNLQRVEFLVEPQTNGQGALVRRVTRNLLAPQTVEPASETICRDVRTFSVRYFDGSTWYDTWDSTQDNALPAAVEVVLETEPSGRSEGATRFSCVFLVPCGRGAGDETVSASGAGGES